VTAPNFKGVVKAESAFESDDGRTESHSLVDSTELCDIAMKEIFGLDSAASRRLRIVFSATN
jgi:hypothetical protein